MRLRKLPRHRHRGQQGCSRMSSVWVVDAIELACAGVARKARAALSGLGWQRHGRWCRGRAASSARDARSRLSDSTISNAYVHTTHTTSLLCRAASPQPNGPWTSPSPPLGTYFLQEEEGGAAAAGTSYSMPESAKAYLCEPGSTQVADAVDGRP